jgi:hypothetical protein
MPTGHFYLKCLGLQPALEIQGLHFDMPKAAHNDVTNKPERRRAFPKAAL